MRSFFKSLILGIFCGLFFALRLLGSDVVYFSSIICNCAFCYPECSYYDIINITMDLLPIAMFMILFGTDIYRHFCVASAYRFSRCAKRGGWYALESAKLFIKTLIFVSCLPLMGSLTMIFTSEVIYEDGYITLMFYYIAIYTLFVFSFTLLINILAIKWGTTVGFAISIGILLTSIVSLNLWNNVFPLEETEDVTFEQVMQNGKLLKFTPISHLILSWHSSDNTNIDSMINIYGISYDLKISIYVGVISSMILLALGYIVVKKVELFFVKKEMED